MKLLRTMCVFKYLLQCVILHLVESVSNKRQGAPRDLVDPWKEFKRLAFPPEGPKSLCREKRRFQFVMSAFNHYENEVN